MARNNWKKRAIRVAPIAALGIAGTGAIITSGNIQGAFVVGTCIGAMTLSVKKMFELGTSE